jgi:hypothetical protein
MECLENNKFGYTYIIDDDSDLTPPNDQLESMDTYMLDQQLLNFMQQVLEGADQSFYQNNTDIANDFLPGPAYRSAPLMHLATPATMPTTKIAS